MGALGAGSLDVRQSPGGPLAQPGQRTTSV